MGDKLRSELAISSDWNKKEIRSYNEIALKELVPVYIIENLSKDAPANRARYCDQKLGIEDKGKIEMQILDAIKKQGKPIALMTLEKIALKKFY